MTTLVEALPRIDGHRITHTWVDVLDRDDRRLARLDGVTSWEVTQREAADVRGGMTLRFDDRGGDAIDWLSVRFQPWKAVNDVRWPLGVYLPRSPIEQHSRYGLSLDVTLLDKTSVLRDSMPGTYAVAPGAVVTDVIKQLILDAGEEKVAVTPSPQTQRTLTVFEPGLLRIQIINSLLESINYVALWADLGGWLRADPYRRPQDRPVAATFQSGAGAIHSPEWTRQQALSDIPNQVVLLSPGDADEPPLIGVAQNTDPASPYSIPSRDRIVSRPEDPERVEATTQAEIDALAARRLADAQTPVATIDVQCAPVPLNLGDVVRFAPSASHERLVTVQEWSDSSDPNADMSATWREVRDA